MKVSVSSACRRNAVVLLLLVHVLRIGAVCGFLALPSFRAPSAVLRCNVRLAESAVRRNVGFPHLRGGQAVASAAGRVGRTVLRMAVLPDTTDPYLLLGLDPMNPTTDRTEIKRAYKRQALKFHPDVVVTADSTSDEKRKANEDFAKINAAYEMLSGKNGAGVGSGVAGRSTSSSSGAGAGYQPPHRRSGAYKPPASGASTDWRDYMPTQEDDEQYDTGGDSFEKIFSDLLTGMAGAAAGAAASGGGGGGGILKDLVEFLESNVDGFSGGYDSDPTLDAMLITGSVEEVGNEMDDTELMVQQLSTKLDGMEKELIQVKADVKVAMRFVEKMELEERMAELEARKEIVEGYLKKARKRLVKLQSRYKELIVQGRGTGRGDVGGAYGSRSSTSSSTSGSSYDGSWSSASSRSSSTSYGSRASSSSSTTDGSSSTSSTTAGSASGTNEADENAWKSEGFGSYGRRGGRGTARRGRARERQQQQQTGATSSSSSGGNAASSTGRTSQQRQTASTSDKPSSSSAQQNQRQKEGKDWTPPVPPHRRTSSYETQQQENRRRLREIQVDEDFENLKKDLGL